MGEKGLEGGHGNTGINIGDVGAPDMFICKVGWQCYRLLFSRYRRERADRASNWGWSYTTPEATKSRVRSAPRDRFSNLGRTGPVVKL